MEIQTPPRAMKVLLTAALLATLLLALRIAGAAEPATLDQTQQRLQAAQERLEQAAREVADLSLSLNDEDGTRVIRMTRHIRQGAALGVAIDVRDGGRSSGSDGVRVVSVSPGGAAEAAGIHANDVIVSINGKALKDDGKQSAAQQMLAQTRELKPGDNVALEFRRDGKVNKAQLVAKNLPEDFVGRGPPGVPGIPGVPEVPAMPGMPGAPGAPGAHGEFDTRIFRFMNRDAGGFGATELVEVSPALGSYFGADKGLLVVRAPHDQRLKLQDGDVLQDIDGRVPGSVAHAFQILSSYRAGETVKLHVLRQKKRVELSVEVPEEMRGPKRNVATPGAPPAPPPSPPPAPPRRDPGAT